MQSKHPNYEILDQPHILNRLFHPRPQIGGRPSRTGREDIMIQVDDDVHIGASLHLARPEDPVLLFFHGNGEIVSDYDDLGQFFSRAGLNFLVVDYRGYGQSTGQPMVSAMMADCQAIADFTTGFLASRQVTGPLCIMGRSLGSASAIELAATRRSQFHCLIVESGFAWMSPLLTTLGIDAGSLGLKKQGLFENVDKIKQVFSPCLVIHAEYDHIIPYTDGQALFDACPSTDKELLKIKNANHNDIFLQGMDLYLSHVKDICSRPSEGGSNA